jgi:crotonobetainyl-CoA:carnitine CoA-transferase CaiB-like acyl-CoA transferase
LRAGSSVNDIMGGMFGAIGILAALRRRDRTGRGGEVTASLFENNVFLMAQHMAQYAVTEKPAAPMPQRLSVWAVYDVFDTADDDQVFVGVVTDTQWRRFCEAFDLPDYASDPELATNPQRVAARDRLMPRLREIFGALTKPELMAKLEAVARPAAARRARARAPRRARLRRGGDRPTRRRRNRAGGGGGGGDRLTIVARTEECHGEPELRRDPRKGPAAA